MINICAHFIQSPVVNTALSPVDDYFIEMLHKSCKFSYIYSENSCSPVNLQIRKLYPGCGLLGHTSADLLVAGSLLVWEGVTNIALM